MPRIEDLFLDCSIYLYPSRVSADLGVAAGGTGFIVGVPPEPTWELPPGVRFCYAVTNAHVIEGSHTHIRVNTKDGRTDVFSTEQRHWEKHPAGDDVAVWDIGLDESIHKVTATPFESALTKDVMEQSGIGPGDDVCLVGRFVNVEGKQRNTPAVRFGHISMMPDEPIDQRPDRDCDQESIIVECHSIAGFSGSPVFVYEPTSLWDHMLTRMKEVRESGVKGLEMFQRIFAEFPTEGDPVERRAYRARVFKLLGVQWGYIAGMGSTTNTGMMGVVPAWKLRELLMQQKLVEKRKAEAEEYKKIHPPKSGLTTP